MSMSFRMSAAALAIGLAVVTPAAAEEAFTPDEKAAIEGVVRDYLLENPEIIVEVLTILQERQETAARDQQTAQIASLEDAIFKSPGSPVIGNPAGDVTLVEFFDYQCGYCKAMQKPMNDLLSSDSDLRVVMKEFPVLGPVSVTAARASLAAEMQGKYAAFHDALMGHRGRLTEEVIFDVARRVGLDIDQLKADMESDSVATEIAANLRLAQQLGINGTPSFVVGDQIVPGAVDIQVLQGLIAEERNAG